MKKFLFLFVFIPLLGISQGIQFNESSWNDLLSKAKSENKLIFVDAYTTWCGPCKAMAKNVFTDEKVAAFYNANFVNAKIDMEKGEGITIAKKYAVEAYPTYLFVDGNGDIVHRAIGYIESGSFIQLGKDANDPSKQLGKLAEKFKNGERNPEFLLNLVKAATEAYDPNAATYATAYFKTQKNLITKENIELILQTVIDPNAYEIKTLVKNEVEASKLFEPDFVTKSLDNIVLQNIAKDLNMEETIESNLKNIGSKLNEVRPSMTKEYLPLIGIYLAEQNEDSTNVEKYTIQYVDGSFDKLDSQQLNQYAWTMFENSDNKDNLKKALKWGLKSVELESNFYNNDTVANLYHKLGDKKNAKVYAKKAIELGQAAGEDTFETEELLKKL